jgi:hypothetical protein
MAPYMRPLGRDRPPLRPIDVPPEVGALAPSAPTGGAFRCSADARLFARRANCRCEPSLGSTVPGTNMNTPQWMIEAPAHAPRRVKSARNRRSADRAALNLFNVALAFLAMLVTMWSICELNALLLH